MPPKHHAPATRLTFHGEPLTIAPDAEAFRDTGDWRIVEMQWDNPLAVAAYQAALAWTIAECPGTITYDKQYDIGKASAELQRDRVSTYVAAEAGFVIGGITCGHLEELGRPYTYLGSLFCVPAAQKQGVGRSLMIAGLEDARQYGAEAVILGVYTSNVPAYEWYTRLGFTLRAMEQDDEAILWLSTPQAIEDAIAMLQAHECAADA